MSNSRPHKKQLSIWRRRVCQRCHRSFTTHEQPRPDQRTTVLQENGASVPFRLSQLTLSIASAFQHDNEAAKRHALSLAETTEQLLATDYPSPSNADISAVTYQVLQRFDPNAAVQYAAQHQLLTRY